MYTPVEYLGFVGTQPSVLLLRVMVGGIPGGIPERSEVVLFSEGWYRIVLVRRFSCWWFFR